MNTVFNELYSMKRRITEDRIGGKMFVEKLIDNTGEQIEKKKMLSGIFYLIPLY